MPGRRITFYLAGMERSDTKKKLTCLETLANGRSCSPGDLVVMAQSLYVTCFGGHVFRPVANCQMFVVLLIAVVLLIVNSVTCVSVYAVPVT